MKNLNASYFKFFFFRYGVIVVAIHLLMVPAFLFTKDADLVLLACLSFSSLFFPLLLCLSEYYRLKKHISLANVVLTDDTLLINEKPYTTNEIESVTSLFVQDALDKGYTYFIEIKTIDGKVYHFLDQPMNWKFQSPTTRLLVKHPQFSSKVKNEKQVLKGFSGMNIQR